MGKCPAFQFYPNDWIGDNQLQMASTTTKGVWIQLLCRMWWAPQRGRLEGTREDLCKIAMCTLEELETFLREAESLQFAEICHQVTDDNTKVTVINRRMEREERSRKFNASRQARYKERHSNASVTVASPSPSTPSPSPTTKQERKTLAPAVDKTTAWAATLDEVRQFLIEIQAPDPFFNEMYWLRIDQWVGGPQSGVYYFSELKAYLANQASKNGNSRGKHKDLLAGFRNWLSMTKRWRDRDAERRTIAERQSHPRN